VALFSYRTLASALAYAADQGYHVVSISLGGVWSSDSLLRALRYATERGVITTAAAGNSPAPAVVYPAKYEETVAVCATDCRDRIWDKACEGDDVDVSAPGESIWRAVTGLADAYDVRRSNGTSYSAAIVAGAAALWLAFHGRDWLIGRYGAAQLPAVFKEVLMTAGVDRPANWDRTRHGAGILNAEKLLQAELPDVPRGAGLRGLRAAPGPRRKDGTGELARFVPGIGPIELRRSLVRLLHTTERELGTVLAEHADELAFQLAIDPALRARLESRRSGRRAPLAPGSTRSASTVSPALRRRLGPR
jgi:serine protease